MKARNLLVWMVPHKNSAEYTYISSKFVNEESVAQ